MKHTIVGVIIGILLAVFINVASAEYRCKHCNYEPPESPQAQTTVTNYGYDAAALNAAISQSHFDFSTVQLQGSAGWGYIEGQSAVAGSIGKRLDNEMLIHGTIGCSTSGEVCGGGAGITIRFK